MASTETFDEAPAAEDVIYAEPAPEAEAADENAEPFYYASVNADANLRRT